MRVRWLITTGRGAGLVAALSAWGGAQSTSRDVRLTLTEGTSMAAALSPDGTRLAFQAYYRDTWNIWTMKADGTETIGTYRKDGSET